MNLRGVNKKGEKENYYKPCGELNAREAAQHLGYWNAKIEEDRTQFSRYYDFHKRRHGKKLQRLLNFAMPIGNKEPVA